ncbi:hypothetical protein T439DRAFT_365659 [Meredithblackwellia eburnea MCA 4105]
MSRRLVQQFKNLNLRRKSRTGNENEDPQPSSTGSTREQGSGHRDIRTTNQLESHGPYNPVARTTQSVNGVDTKPPPRIFTTGLDSAHLYSMPPEILQYIAQLSGPDWLKLRSVVRGLRAMGLDTISEQVMVMRNATELAMLLDSETALIIRSIMIRNPTHESAELLSNGCSKERLPSLECMSIVAVTSSAILPENVLFNLQELGLKGYPDHERALPLPIPERFKSHNLVTLTLDGYSDIEVNRTISLQGGQTAFSALQNFAALNIWPGHTRRDSTFESNGIAPPGSLISVEKELPEHSYTWQWARHILENKLFSFSRHLTKFGAHFFPRDVLEMILHGLAHKAGAPLQELAIGRTNTNGTGPEDAFQMRGVFNTGILKELVHLSIQVSYGETVFESESHLHLPENLKLQTLALGIFHSKEGYLVCKRLIQASKLTLKQLSIFELPASMSGQTVTSRFGDWIGLVNFIREQHISLQSLEIFHPKLPGNRELYPEDCHLYDALLPEYQAALRGLVDNMPSTLSNFSAPLTDYSGPNDFKRWCHITHWEIGVYADSLQQEALKAKVADRIKAVIDSRGM